MKLTLTINGKSYEIPEDQVETRIGRNHGDIKNDIDIPADDISRNHCSILQDEKGIHLKDNGSKYGTVVRGKSISGDTHATLEDGDEIILGKSETMILIKIDDDELKLEPNDTVKTDTPTEAQLDADIAKQENQQP